ncbi:Glycosyl hydrolases family 18 [Poriferisphaera corsica]|uniref:chitinase n=2 Tax=Poriferisphaera corsica TaxID=2528020 RepID=A0A517YP19_9BACT|nr:Glycosyl hydrolases family 18 [Poriferisphaera corsica]
MFNDCKKLTEMGRVCFCALLVGAVLFCVVEDGWGADRSRSRRRRMRDRERAEQIEKVDEQTEEKAEVGEEESGEEKAADDEGSEKDREEALRKKREEMEAKRKAAREKAMQERAAVKDELKVGGVRPVRGLEAAEFRVYGYMPDYVKAFWPKVKMEYLTDVIFFKAGMNIEAEVSMGQGNVDFLKRMSRAAKGKGLKVHVAIGGWRTAEIQKKYVKVMTTLKLRRKLVREISLFVKKHRLDGFNLDWEYPDPGEQTKGYSEFLYELTMALKGGKKTVGTAVMQKIPMLLKRGFAQDAVMTMTYDFQPVNSPIDKVKESVNYWLSLMKKNGIKNAEEKLVMGVPFYGRDLKTWSKAKGYGTILKENPGISEDVDEVKGVAFTNIKSMRERVAWAIDKRLKGVMIWQLGQDAVGEKSLLKAIYKEIMMKKGLPDLNFDGMLTKGDLMMMRRNWLEETLGEEDVEKAWGMGDLNADGKVDGKDVGIVKKSWKDGGKALTVIVGNKSNG